MWRMVPDCTCMFIGDGVRNVQQGQGNIVLAYALEGLSEQV
jgi:hypothetical protein